ncbi:N/A [soil metagenome]
MSSTVKAKHEFKWVLMSQVLSQFLGMVTFIVFARFLSAIDMGLIAFSYVLMFFFFTFLGGAVKEPIIQATEVDQAALSTMFWMSLAASSTTMIILFLFGPSLATVLGAPLAGPFIAVLCLKFPMDAVCNICMAILARKLDLRKSSTNAAVSSAFGAICGIVAALCHLGIWSAAIQQLGTAVVATIMFVAVTRWLPSFTFSWTKVKPLVDYGKSVAGWQIVEFLSRQGDRALIGILSGPTILGLYSVGRRINDVTTSVSIGALSTVLFPLFSGLKNDKDKLRRTFESATLLLTFWSIPISAGMVFLAHLIVPVVLGHRWMPAVPIVQAFSLLGFIQAVGYLQTSIIRSQGHPDWWFKYMLFGMVFGFAVVGVAAQFGMTVLAFAIVARIYAQWPLTINKTARLLDIKISHYYKIFLQPMISAGLMVVSLYILEMILSPYVTWKPLMLATLIAAGGLFYLGYSLLIFRQKAVWSIVTTYNVMLKRKSAAGSLA